MPGRKKKFIDKKNAVTFSLVHRSQKDPLQADDKSSKFVLQQVQNPNDKGKENKIEEQQKYGVYFDDEYNYLQHLREADAENAWELQATPGKGKSERKVHFDVEDLTLPQSEQKPKLQLPAEVFPSKQEEDVGLLNRAAPISGPRLDLDPDIVAAMDDDFDFDDPDNELDDDFILAALGEKDLSGSKRDVDDDEDDDSDEDEDDDDDEESGEDYDSDDLDDIDQMSFTSEETKSRFTSYSLTSSVMQRNDGLTLLDDRFEKLYEQYDDMEIGALDQDEIEGYVQDESAILSQVLNEFEEVTKVTTMNEIETERIPMDGELEEEEEEEEEEKEEKIRLYIDEKKERWDCESILSTYSTIYNHPTTIKEPSKQRRKKEQSNNDPATLESGQIRLSQKTGMPLGVLPSHGPTKKQLERADLDDTTFPAPQSLVNRKKGVKETAEEKKARKQAVQQGRKERRVEKKANKQAFKDEEIRQEKVMKNLKQNLQGVKIL